MNSSKMSDINTVVLQYVKIQTFNENQKIVMRSAVAFSKMVTLDGGVTNDFLVHVLIWKITLVTFYVTLDK